MGILRKRRRSFSPCKLFCLARLHPLEHRTNPHVAHYFLQKKLTDGQLPYVDPRYRNRSYAEGRLVDIMEQCWKYDPDKRIDIFSVVKLLREAVAENKKLAPPKKKGKQ